MSLNNNLIYNKYFLKEKLYEYIKTLYAGSYSLFEEDKKDLEFLKDLTYQELFDLFDIKTFNISEPISLEHYNNNILNTINSLKCLEFLINSIILELNKFKEFEIAKLNSLDKLKNLVAQKINTLNIHDNKYKYIYKSVFIDSTYIDSSSSATVDYYAMLPIKEKKEIIPLSFSVGNGSIGSFGSFDKDYPSTTNLNDLLNNIEIQWESITNTCLLNLEVSFSIPQIVNEINLSIGSISDIENVGLISIKAIENSNYKVIYNEEKNLIIGNNSIKFYPIKTSRIIITLNQSQSYLTKSNIYRKVIALSGINFYQNKYDSKCTLKSLPIEIYSSVFTCLPFINIKPTNNNLFTITGSYSLDDKKSFSNIFDIHNNLNISSIYYDLVIERNDNAFSYNSSLDQLKNIYTINTQTELISPYRSPTNIALNKKSINNNIVCYKPNVMAVGGDFKLFPIGNGTGVELNILLNKSITEEEAENATLKVNGQKWTYVNDLTAETAEAKVWSLNKEDYQTIVFGDNTNGLSPASGATITFSLDLEILKFEEFDGGYLAKVDNLFDPDKDQIKLISVSEDKLNGKFIFPKNARVIKLPYSNLVEGSLSFTEKTSSGMAYGTKLFTTEETFVDGTSELSAVGDYSINYRNGYVYCYQNIQQDNNVTCSFSFYPTKNIEQNQFDIYFEDKPKGIFFNSNNLPTRTYTDYVVSTPSKVSTLNPYGLSVSADDAAMDGDYQFNLSRKGIIKNSLNCYNLFSDTSIVPQEVEYIDGYSEFLNLIKVTQETIASFSGAGIKTFTLFGGEQFYSPLGISFSDTSYFASEKTSSGALSVAGDYYINTSTGTVSVYTSNGLPGTITCSYYYKGNNHDPTNLYSVNYKKGIIHSLTPWVDGGYVQYKTTNIYIAYSIIELLPKVSLEAKSNILSIKSDGFYNKIDLVKIAYPCEDLSSNIEELKNYYSPLIENIEFRFK